MPIYKTQKPSFHLYSHPIPPNLMLAKLDEFNQERELTAALFLGHTPSPQDKEFYPETFDNEAQKYCYMREGGNIFDQMAYVDSSTVEYPDGTIEVSCYCQLNNHGDSESFPLDYRRLGSCKKTRATDRIECRGCLGLSRLLLRAYVMGMLKLLESRDLRAENRERLVLATHSRAFLDLATNTGAGRGLRPVLSGGAADQEIMRIWTDALVKLTWWQNEGLQVVVWRVPFWVLKVGRGYWRHKGRVMISEAKAENTEENADEKTTETPSSGADDNKSFDEWADDEMEIEPPRRRRGLPRRSYHGSRRFQKR